MPKWEVDGMTPVARMEKLQARASCNGSSVDPTMRSTGIAYIKHRDSQVGSRQAMMLQN